MQVDTLSLEALATILEHMEAHDIQDLGTVLVTTGIHPQLGECSTMQDAVSGQNLLMMGKSGMHFRPGCI